MKMEGSAEQYGNPAYQTDLTPAVCPALDLMQSMIFLFLSLASFLIW